MGLMDEVRLYEDENGNAPSGPQQILRTAIKSGAGMLSGVSYDFVAATYPDSVTEVFTFKLGGAGGTTKAVITIVYTDGSKDLISTVTKV